MFWYPPVQYRRALWRNAYMLTLVAHHAHTHRATDIALTYTNVCASGRKYSKNSTAKAMYMYIEIYVYICRCRHRRRNGRITKAFLVASNQPGRQVKAGADFERESKRVRRSCRRGISNHWQAASAIRGSYRWLSAGSAFPFLTLIVSPLSPATRELGKLCDRSKTIYSSTYSIHMNLSWYKEMQWLQKY